MKKGFFVLIAIYLFLFLFNYLTPMSFGDDYLYSFVWQGKSMFLPLTEDAVRISSWKELFLSQWLHYLTWGGRTVAHVIVQLFLWAGKNVFNYFNALVGVILVVEIYWLIHKGKISTVFSSKDLCWIFFALWAFTPAFCTVFFWLTAACNYLWTNVILLGFLIPYTKQYYSIHDKKEKSVFLCSGMFFYGIIAGWTNENSVCLIILLLLAFIVSQKKIIFSEKWIYAGFLGLVAGYALLMWAPGNLVRLSVEREASAWLTLKSLSEHFKILFLIFLFQTFLWYFNLRSLYFLNKSNVNETINHELILVKALCVISFCSTAIMLFSTGFPPRSGFFGTIVLIIASGILLRMKKEYNLDLVQDNAKKFLSCVGCIYFIITAVFSFRHFYDMNLQMNELLTFVKTEQLKDNTSILNVQSFNKTTLATERLSGFHVLGYELSEDENDWMNVAFSRYYGIKGIRVRNSKSDSEAECTSERVKTEAGSKTAVHRSR